jgi:hypothetical protein
MDETSPVELFKRIDKGGERVRDWFNAFALNLLLLIFGPALILIGVHSLPPQWRPGLHWPIHGERAPASIESIQLALRHVDNNPKIDNVQASINVTLAYQDRSGKLQHAQLAGPWLLQMATQHTGDAAWLYLADIARGIGTGPLQVDMPRDVAAQLAVSHEEFAITEQTAANLDRPLRWVALNWLAPEQALAVRYDPQRPAVAIPEFVIERESTRLQGAGVLRILGFVLGCILVAAFTWHMLTPLPRIARALAVAVVVATVLLWAPYVSSLVRLIAPGIDEWSGLNIDDVVADPIGVFYDEFRAGPYYVAAKNVPAAEGTAWTPANLSSHALTQWLRSVPIEPVRGSIEDAESALATAAPHTLRDLSDVELGAIGAELQVVATRKYWIGSSAHYSELRDAVRVEQDRRAGVR